MSPSSAKPYVIVPMCFPTHNSVHHFVGLCRIFAGERSSKEHQQIKKDKKTGGRKTDRNTRMGEREREREREREGEREREEEEEEGPNLQSMICHSFQ